MTQRCAGRRWPGRSTPDQTARLTAYRTAYDELSEVYDGLRRMVERGYLPFKPAANGFFKA